MSTATTVLRDMLTQHGKLTPALVVEEASSPVHPLHHRFTWDDGEAGHKWRLVEARELIRSVRVETTDSEGHSESVRGFVRLLRPVPTDDSDLSSLANESYLPVETVGQDPVLRAALLEQMRRDWMTLRRKYQAHAEFWELLRTEPDIAVAG